MGAALGGEGAQWGGRVHIVSIKQTQTCLWTCPNLVYVTCHKNALHKDKNRKGLMKEMTCNLGLNSQILPIRERRQAAVGEGKGKGEPA